MENHYEKKPISRSIEIKAAYEYAVKHNIKYYRCISKTGVIYGWNGNAHVRAADGQEWFENPKYVESKITTEVPAEDAPVSETVATTDSDENSAEETVAITGDSTAVAVVKKNALDGIRAKFEEKVATIEQLNATIADITAELTDAKTKLSALSNENESLKTELSNKETEIEKLKADYAELEAAINDIELL